MAPPPAHPSGPKATSRTSANPEIRIDEAVVFADRLRAILSLSDPNVDLASAPAPTMKSAMALVGEPVNKTDPNTLASEAAKHVSRIYHILQTYKLKCGHPEIDSVATMLWNTCTRFLRELKDDKEPQEAEHDEQGITSLQMAKRAAEQKDDAGRGSNEKSPAPGLIYIYGKVLAFYLLGVAKLRDKRVVGGLVKLLRLGLKVVRDCVDAGEVELATRVMQISTDYKVGLHNKAAGLPEEDARECYCLEVEYLIMRTSLCWLESRLDVAEHMYKNSEPLHQYLTPEHAERLADVLYEIGKSLSSDHNFVMAIKWLKRASEVINSQELEQLSREGLELRLAILQAMVTAFLGTETPEALEEAQNQIAFMESEASNKFVVALLKLELLQKMPAEVFDTEAYGDILRHIIRSFPVSDSAFKLIMHHTRRLHDKSPGAGCAVLDDLILALSRAEKYQWVEKAVVTRVWMITNQRDTVETIKIAEDVLGKLSTPLSAEAAVAAQALLWKKLESNYAQGHYDLAERWCQLSLNHAFSKCGAGNTSKLERKLLMCSLARNSLDAATAIIHKMSPQSRKEPMTAYLAFKVAMRVEDHAMAEKCLATIAQAPDHVDYLGACIAESQKAGDIICAIAALRKLQEKYEYKEPNPIHLPALFRCTIRLLHLMLDRAGDDKGDTVEALCTEFEAVVLALQREQKNPPKRKLFTVDELEWFSRSAYNLALKNTAVWDLRSVIRMLGACVEIISHFPSDVDCRMDLSLKALFAHFVISSALVALARTQDKVEKQRDDYSTMRKHVAAFDSELPQYLPKLDEQSRADILRKHAALLAFDFEAAVALQQWDDLGGIVQLSIPCKNVTAFQAMADCLLRAQAPGQILYSTIRKIVNEIWILERFDAAKLAKYTRCLFQATLPLDDGLAMRLLDDVCGKARELKQRQAIWPGEELEWIVTTSFNHAIDCYGVRELERAKEWATKAINLAHYCPDQRLEEILQRKYLRLNLDGGAG
ncbi:hypothetical protein VTJ04DRAFT_8685 [Mycothermus thermophilus]|uniref:uncharacterized protein n=1 Tax=Humicola insolens TaxID=85995 RepID=UPI0037442960